MFQQNLKATLNFANLLRTGLPDTLIEYLKKPDNYYLKLHEKIKKHPKKDSEREKNKTSSNCPMPDISQKIGEPREIPREHTELVGFDCVGINIPGNGACFYGSASQFLHGDFNQFRQLRSDFRIFVLGSNFVLIKEIKVKITFDVQLDIISYYVCNIFGRCTNSKHFIRSRYK